MADYQLEKSVFSISYSLFEGTLRVSNDTNIQKQKSTTNEVLYLRSAGVSIVSKTYYRP